MILVTLVVNGTSISRGATVLTSSMLSGDPGAGSEEGGDGADSKTTATKVTAPVVVVGGVLLMTAGLVTTLGTSACQFYGCSMRGQRCSDKKCTRATLKVAEAGQFFRMAEGDDHATSRRSPQTPRSMVEVLGCGFHYIKQLCSESECARAVCCPHRPATAN